MGKTSDSEATSAAGRRRILAAALLWSLGGVFAKRLPLNAPTIAFYRSLFAGLALLPFVPMKRWVLRPAMVPCALIFGVMIGSYLAAIKATTAANAIFLQCTSTLWLVPASALILREPPDRRSVLGIALAMVGVVAIVLYGSKGGSGEGQGIALGLASGVAYAAVVIGLRWARDLDPTWLAAVNNLGGALALGAWLSATSGGIAVPTAGQVLALAGFGALQMAIPYALFARGLRTVPAPEAGLIGLLEPVLNPIWVVLFAREWPAPATVLGGASLLAGVACRYWPGGARNRPGGKPPGPRS